MKIIRATGLITTRLLWPNSGLINGFPLYLNIFRFKNLDFANKINNITLQRRQITALFPHLHVGNDKHVIRYFHIPIHPVYPLPPPPQKKEFRILSIREFKHHSYVKRQTSDASREFLKIENEQMKTA